MVKLWVQGAWPEREMFGSVLFVWACNKESCAITVHNVDDVNIRQLGSNKINLSNYTAMK